MDAFEMDPIEQLMAEHRVIEDVLDALESYVARLDDGADPADLARFVTFLRAFADGCHHGKEEDILFVTLVQQGFPRDSGPVAMMLWEHEEGRRHVGALLDLAERRGRSQPWTAEDRLALASHSRAYAALLRAHILKEDQILYPMARRHLASETIADMARRFGEFEARPDPENGGHEGLHALAEDLIARHGTRKEEA